MPERQSATTSIAVIIAAYNAETTIARAITSALAAPEVTEVIVVDDRSSDDTVWISRQSDDHSGRLKIFEQSVNQGPAAARNRAIRESGSEWIAILDSDDFFIEDRFAKLLPHLAGAEMVADDLWQVPEDDISQRNKTLLDKYYQQPQQISLTEFVESNLSDSKKQRCELGFLKPLISRSFLLQHELQYKEDMRLGEDYELYVRVLASGGRLLVVPEAGYVSVVRAGSLSGLHSPHDLKLLRDCNTDIEHIYTLNRSQKQALRRHFKNTDCRLQWRYLIQAVKDRNPVHAAQTFLRPWPVPAYLAARLWERLLHDVHKNRAE